MDSQQNCLSRAATDLVRCLWVAITSQGFLEVRVMDNADIQLEHSSLIGPAVKILKWRIRCLVQTLTIQNSETTDIQTIPFSYLNLLPKCTLFKLCTQTKYSELQFRALFSWAYPQRVSRKESKVWGYR